jgi:hypothetical protein
MRLKAGLRTALVAGVAVMVSIGVTDAQAADGRTATS